MELTEFIAARLDEDEAAAEEAASRPLGAAWDDGTRLTAVARHINRHDPARVLREVAAKRAILAQREHSPAGSPVLTYALYCLAEIWSDHPDYRQEWAPLG